MRILLFFALGLTLPLLASAQDEAAYEVLPSIDLPPELDRVLRDYEAAWAGNDAAALSALFTPDGFVRSTPGWIRGREAIELRYAQTGGALSLRALAYSISPSTGYIVGAYGYGTGEDVADSGSFVLALRKGESGRWLIAADLDHSNR